MFSALEIIREAKSAVTYEEFQARSHFSEEEVLALAYGRLIDDAPSEYKARLPLPPMLMVDRIEHISSKGNRGRMVAERDVRLDNWFFQCHFLGDARTVRLLEGCLGQRTSVGLRRSRVLRPDQAT